MRTSRPSAVSVLSSGSWRTAGDTRAPRGVLPFSDVRGHDAGAGIGLVDLVTELGTWRVGA
ncbi:hypothetical protein, partial [Gemmatimonas sp.]|uniref:hypothetical protein n=1 Tax=Gemmatimonas sp. TaxID=1962908 RepID=UPI00391A70C6